MSATAAFRPGESNEEDTTACLVFLVYLVASRDYHTSVRWAKCDPIVRARN
jgi:hypothetical protein